jgi:hypothetical protein
MGGFIICRGKPFIMDHGDHFLYKVYIIYVYVPLDLLSFQIYFKYILGL